MAKVLQIVNGRAENKWIDEWIDWVKELHFIAHVIGKDKDRTKYLLMWLDVHYQVTAMSTY